MPQPYSDDLRCMLLEGYEAGQGTLRESAKQFRVSWGYSKKIRTRESQMRFIISQRLRIGRKERPQQKRHGPVGRVTPQVQQQLRSAVRQQPDVTLAELQQRIQQRWNWRSWLWVWLQRLGLRHKKNRSVRKNKNRPRTSGGGRRDGN